MHYKNHSRRSDNQSYEYCTTNHPDVSTHIENVEKSRRSPHPPQAGESIDTQEAPVIEYNMYLPP
jgi:hypothetical protein